MEAGGGGRREGEEGERRGRRKGERRAEEEGGGVEGRVQNQKGKDLAGMTCLLTFQVEDGSLLCSR